MSVGYSYTPLQGAIDKNKHAISPIIESRTFEEASLSSRLQSRKSITRLKWILFSLLSCTTLLIAFFAGFLFRSSQEHGQKRDLVPELPYDTQTFKEHKTYSMGPSDDSNAAWNDMIPLGNGWVRLREYPGAPASTDGADIFNIAVYHQLHCLNELRLAYYSLLMPTSSSNHSGHVVHCIDYLRQSIACSVDTTLEPFDQDLGGTLTWGVEHQCRSLRILDAWAQENRPWDRKDITR